MPYCTLDDLIGAFGESEIRQRSDRARPPAGVIDPAVVDQAIADADAEINMFLEGRGLLPLKSVPVTLRRMACDISRYYLYQNPPEDHPATRRYQDRLRQLTGVAKGTLSLGLDDAGKVQEPEMSVEFTPGRNMFRNNGGLW
ncbi:gp436 family protein [Salmonella enterica]